MLNKENTITKTLHGNEHINAMCKAMRKAGLSVDRSKTTVKGYYGKKVVFRAMRHSKVKHWIVSHHMKLFI